MGTLFSEKLSYFRKEAGFKTAYRFFHDNGGKTTLKISYRMYLLMEQGKLLPPFKNLPIYIYSLGFPMRSHPAMELAVAWLKTSLGEESFKNILEPFLKLPDKESIPSPLHKTMKSFMAKNKFRVTPEQMKTIASDENIYLCWIVFSNDSAKWDTKSISGQIGLSPAAAKKALEKLYSSGLIKKLKDGFYRSATTDLIVEYPHGNTEGEIAGISRKFQAMREKVIGAGSTVYSCSGVLRASFTELANCFPLLGLNVSSAGAYSLPRKQKDSALFGVISKVVKIRDF